MYDKARDGRRDWDWDWDWGADVDMGADANTSVSAQAEVQASGPWTTDEPNRTTASSPAGKR